jgi:pimeloyl-ACP methyl ester carboxylesterase
VTTETINGTTLAYDVAGEGESLVLIHGSWGQRETWQLIMPGLAESFRVVSYDRRGHGESIGPPDAGTVHDDVADAAALIEAMDAAPAYVVANSYGSCIALRLAAERPELVKRMVCHEPPMMGMLEASTDHKPLFDDLMTKMAEVRRRLEGGDARDAAEYFVENVALGPGAWALVPPPMQDMFVQNAPTFLGELRDPDAVRIDVDALTRIQAPVLLTNGDQSPAMFAPIADELAGAIPNIRRQTLTGVGHVPHMTHPDDYVALVKSSLLG